jgi:hypothetical protein
VHPPRQAKVTIWLKDDTRLSLGPSSEKNSPSRMVSEASSSALNAP